jgi:hypothetical protein
MQRGSTCSRYAIIFQRRSHRPPSFFCESRKNLAGGFFNRHHPEESFTLGHGRVNQTRANVADVNGQFFRPGFGGQTFQVVDLPGF